AEYVIEAHDVGTTFTLTATGLSSNQTATATFTDGASVTDFRQGANNETQGTIQGPGNIHWINSIVQQGNSTYFEGMSVPQRLIFTGITATSGNVHTLTFLHQATKSADNHAYDFQTSWEQAVLAADTIAPGQGLMAQLLANRCGDEIGPPGNLNITCNSLAASAFIATPSWPDSMGTVLGDNVDTRIAAYENCFGNRTLKIYGDAAITAASITFNGYTGTDLDANYTLTWTSASTQVLIEYAGHISVGTEASCPGIGYGANRGAASISGGPYHQKVATLDGASLGKQDNQ